MFKIGKKSTSPLQTGLNLAADALFRKQQKQSHKLRNSLIVTGVVGAAIAAMNAVSKPGNDA
jgi:hypothetical protein